MKTLCVFIAICALSWVSCQSSQECNFGMDAFLCLSKMAFDISVSSTHFMEEVQLDKSCKKFLPATQCMAEVAEKCKQNETALMESFIDQHDNLKALCEKDGDYRREYLKHGRCLNENKSKYQLECYDGTPIPHGRKPDAEECQTYKTSVKTCESSIRSTCGDDALAMVRRLLKPFDNYYKKTCY